MMSKTTCKENILLILFRSHLSLLSTNLLRAYNFQVSMPLQRLFLYPKHFHGSFIQCMPLQRLLVYHVPLYEPFVYLEGPFVPLEGLLCSVLPLCYFF